ncbi:hypothetical protein ONE63_006908 [Megalurothrips usitatus]|uniref:Uncharacterized protein n=1 Tax=Megalurothrips usitatus TaxID=439358 RepID=A0AAV7XWR7_9NEOP|nr:hypothetical protein ONE63_006908 [Megalurothrips usitatus]
MPTIDDNDSEAADDEEEDSDTEETTEVPEHDESDPEWEHDDSGSGGARPQPSYLLPQARPPVDRRKYPFYRAPVSEQLTSYTPLRYAINPYDVPVKTEGGMEFYQSRDRLVHCDGPRQPGKVVPERAEDGAWNERPQPDGPRLGTLGDVIGCMRRKLFGADPLDNPFFQETSVGLPEETAMVGLIVDAVGTPPPKTFDQLGFYRDILDNIHGAAASGPLAPDPAEVVNQPYIRVGADAFDSDEAPSSPGNVRVAYAVPKDNVGAVHSSRKYVPVPAPRAAPTISEAAGAGDAGVEDGPTKIKLMKHQLQESAEDDEQDELEEVEERDPEHPDEPDGAHSQSVEYFVDQDGNAVPYKTGSKLEKSGDKKNVAYFEVDYDESDDKKPASKAKPDSSESKPAASTETNKDEDDEDDDKDDFIDADDDDDEDEEEDEEEEEEPPASADDAPSDEDDDDDEDDEEEEEEEAPDASNSNEARAKAEMLPFKTAEEEVDGKGISESEFEKLSKPVSTTGWWD